MTETKHNLLGDKSVTIVAQCTPRGTGAIAMVRFSGDNVVSIVDKMSRLSSGKMLIDGSSHSVHHGYVVDICDDGRIVDEVLFILMKGPRTFTGQDTVEISCHNNSYIIEKIIACAIYHGARYAKPGEFTKRAFLAGKIDLVQAESIHEIICAPTELALQKSMSQLSGSLSNCLGIVEKKVLFLAGLVESSFEFLEEEQQDIDLESQISEKIQTVLQKIKTIKASFSQQQLIKQGVKIVIIGSVNSGKSTLFNSILGKNRAIVSRVKGTTRDSIEVSIYKKGEFWSIVDTAGLRKTKNNIERQGIARSHQEAALADIILLVFDSSRRCSNEELEEYQRFLKDYKNKILVVANKMDLRLKVETSSQFSKDVVFFNISAKNKTGIISLENAIQERINKLFAELQSPFLLNKRQFSIITEMELKLQSVVNSLVKKVGYELIAYQLKEILNDIAELTGQCVSEEILNSVFDTFCIGK
jgi:tRNA modification GTPase